MKTPRPILKTPEGPFGFKSPPTPEHYSPLAPRCQKTPAKAGGGEIARRRQRTKGKGKSDDSANRSRFLIIHPPAAPYGTSERHPRAPSPLRPMRWLRPHRGWEATKGHEKGAERPPPLDTYPVRSWRSHPSAPARYTVKNSMRLWMRLRDCGQRDYGLHPSSRSYEAARGTPALDLASVPTNHLLYRCSETCSLPVTPAYYLLPVAYYPLPVACGTHPLPAAMNRPCYCYLSPFRAGKALGGPSPAKSLVRSPKLPAAVPRCGDPILPSHPSLSTAPLCTPLPKETSARMTEYLGLGELK